MKFRQLRNIVAMRPTAIRWNKSRIVEIMRVTDTGAIEVANIITGRIYRLPPHYQDIDVSILKQDEFIALKDLFPKGGIGKE